ncbi:uncharacterized protein L969DRAFT_67934 [Mixia osmundae IAM 14324]|uniref:Uncharacterized protein n=1 Tax=Mixia osmundae (strain CBS 9802 / IAM 14324 / JCM 22182 / KY 12970) TaxID=764103 RepID=G7E4J0_MIXOS|nr:uncharacterized protein L969DRAFT_67934 [Mixia osmundae IAM 14324]KEI36233.1 hypothetical protein L969DRAFT_67934 [Mixia osmundae IAM 14324]GAA97750.1 hypothetical protein E5Q_04429 [Mixia osmundae IAM 14324]
MDARRKAEIEAKRAKLAELRKAREDRKSQLSQERSASTSDTPPDRPGSSVAARAQLDDLVSTLLADAGAASRPSSASGSEAQASLSGSGTLPPKPASRLPAPAPAPAHAAPPAEAPAASDALNAVQPKYVQPLEQVAPTEPARAPSPARPPPKPRILQYEKGVQTSIATSTSDDEQEGDLPSRTNAGSSTIDEAAVRASIRQEYEAERARLDAQIAEERRQLEQDRRKERLQGLPKEDLEKLFSSGQLGAFLESSSKVVQRAMNDTYDYMSDYSFGGSAAQDGDGPEARGVKLSCIFADERWTAHRSVTSIDWSRRYPELLVASYNKDAVKPSEPEGLACVWNQHLVARPEYVFHANSDLLSVRFAPFHPNLVVGGSYTGQILVWDTRARHLPVLKSPLSAAGHTHPVYSLQMIGTQNANNLVSASTDGTVCAWTLDMLARPQETLELVNPAHAKTNEVSITDFAFPANEAALFFVGTEEGSIFAANRYARAGAKAGLVQSEVYRGHSGPVTSIDFHPSTGPVDFGDLFLSSGADWTAKLWRAKTSSSSAAPKPTRPGVSAGIAGPDTISPLLSFEESDDYIMDARWHPHHPALFGTVNASGSFDLWNLNSDVESPLISTHVEHAKPFGLNKLAWDRKDGKKVALGTAGGQVIVYDLGKQLVTPADEDYDHLRRTLAEAARMS